MAKKKREKIEYRYYKMPDDFPVKALLGDRWIRTYGDNSHMLHFHNYMEIGYCHFGRGEMEFSTSAYKYQENMFTVIAANYPHTTSSEQEAYWEYLYIDVEFFLKMCYGENSVFAGELKRSIERMPLLLSSEENPVTAQLIVSILNEMREQKMYYKEAVLGLLRSLIVEIARVSHRKTGISVGEAHLNLVEFIVPAIEYVNQHYAEEIKISDLSDACGLSEAHFRKIFRENMNLTPGEFLTTFRIQKACERMMENQDSMEEIASKTGFRNANTFGRNFKKYMGISPYQWKLSSIDEKSKIQNYQISALEGW